MSTKEILQGIKRLPFHERLLLIEKAIKTLHESPDTQMENAAMALQEDYNKDKNLTAFTALDYENFYEAR